MDIAFRSRFPADVELTYYEILPIRGIKDLAIIYTLEPESYYAFELRIYASEFDRSRDKYNKVQTYFKERFVL